ncbi:hypothetical protein LINGRAHAP2_LOCUS34144 [Linum grandiflorum]
MQENLTFPVGICSNRESNKASLILDSSTCWDRLRNPDVGVHSIGRLLCIMFIVRTNYLANFLASLGHSLDAGIHVFYVPDRPLSERVQYD